ncbi:T6SS effector BTH_I2691 family protein, partial [Chromohalobacter nigrandesensis]|uniref:T6SS effector BTH_I2691 family protein n=1 Tax=Chromohalobacter nigrandesensis TaxID=119863 RepID=UPI001FF47E7A
MTLAARLNAYAAEGEPGGLQNGQCEFCERKGLPILPVRYAVCQRNDRNRSIPELPEERIREFTDIGLDKAWDENGEHARTVDDEVRPVITDSTSSQVNKYILRQLRQGYLYLYDQDNPDGMYWYAYAITSDGKYYQFPVAQPPTLESTEFPCQDKANDALHASLVTLPNPDRSGTLYYAFSEHAWPIEHIRMIGSDPAWRDRHMQKIDIQAWVAGQSQTFAYGTDELAMVAEYSEGANDLGTQFWSSGPQRDLYSRQELQDAMDLRLDHAASRYQGRGLILAVKDEAGIIDELNAYRHQALAEAEDFVQRSDTNRRKLLCKQAIDAFHENFARNYKTQERQSHDAEIEQLKQERAEERRAFEESLQKQRREGNQANIDFVSQNANAMERRYEQLIRQVEERHQADLQDADEVIADHRDQLAELYDKEALDAFYDDYREQTDICQALLALHDSDYALWVKHHLADVIGRYSQSDYWMGMGLSGLLANGLRGGILSSASGRLWQHLARNVDASDSWVLSALFANQATLVSQARATAEQPPSKPLT